MSWIKAAGAKETYAPGDSLSEISVRYGIPPSEIVKLNANENLFLSKSFQQGLVKEASCRVDPRLYPSEDGRLESELGSYMDVDPESIILGNGSDQLIELLVYTLLKEGDEVVAINPTFSMYRRAAEIRRVDYSSVDLNLDFSLDADRLLDAVTPKTRMMVICNPNNPTGNQFNKEKIIHIMETFDGILVLDEAYVEYANYSMARKAKCFSNVLILRTFSKAFGLAGIRLGFAVANTELATAIKRHCQMPYAVSEISQEIGLHALRNRSTVMDSVLKTVETREWLYRKLNTMEGVKAFESDTNFLLFNTPRPSEEVYHDLLRQGVIIRRFGEVLGHENCLRVTVAPRRELTRFLKALKEALV